MTRLILIATVFMLVSGPAWAIEDLTIGVFLKNFDQLGTLGKLKVQKRFIDMFGLTGQDIRPYPPWMESSVPKRMALWNLR